MTYYLDREYRVRTEPGEARIPWEDADGVFEGKCKTYVEGFRVIPEGESWRRSDGTVFKGFMIAPVVDVRFLQSAQAETEETSLILNELMGGVEDVQQE